MGNKTHQLKKNIHKAWYRLQAPNNKEVSVERDE